MCHEKGAVKKWTIDFIKVWKPEKVNYWSQWYDYEEKMGRKGQNNVIWSEN